jgi:NTE family protein
MTTHQAPRTSPASAWRWPAAVRWAPSTRLARCAPSRRVDRRPGLHGLRRLRGRQRRRHHQCRLPGQRHLTPRELCAGFIENSSAPPDHFDPAMLLLPPLATSTLRRLRKPAHAWPGEAAWKRAGGASLPTRCTWNCLGQRACRPGFLNSDPHGGPTQGHVQSAGPQRRLPRPQAPAAARCHRSRLRRNRTLRCTSGWDHVPISRAVQASAALPGLYPPVEIDGRSLGRRGAEEDHARQPAAGPRHGLDVHAQPTGALRDQPQRPPFTRPQAHPQIGRGRAWRWCCRQTFRSADPFAARTGHAQLRSTATRTRTSCSSSPTTATPSCSWPTLSAISHRRELAEHAYQTIRADLLRRAPDLQVKLGRHGLQLDMPRLLDPTRRLVDVWDTPNRRPLERSLLRLDEILSLLETRARQARAAVEAEAQAD